jgi:ketosteroid isomerase-like protein
VIVLRSNSMKEVIFAFIERINAHDIEGLALLMSDDHTFIDAQGNQVSGREKMIAGWRGYLEWFPDYYIEVSEVFHEDDQLALFGFAGASFKNKEGENWRLPAAWKATVKDGRVTRCTQAVTSCWTSGGSSPSHSGCCAVPSKIEVVLNGSNRPFTAAADVFATNVSSSSWLSG